MTSHRIDLDSWTLKVDPGAVARLRAAIAETVGGPAAARPGAAPAAAGPALRLAGP